MKTFLQCAAVVGIAAGVCYLIYKVDKKNKEEMDEYREACYDGMDVVEEILMASVDNPAFSDKEDSAKAHDILVRQSAKMNVARTKDGFDTHFAKFKEMITNLTNEKPDKALAWLLIYSDDLKKEEKANEELKKDRRERDRRYTELEKARTVARAIDQLGNIAKNTTNGNLKIEDIVKAAESITFTM